MEVLLFAVAIPVPIVVLVVIVVVVGLALVVASIEGRLGLKEKDQREGKEEVKSEDVPFSFPSISSLVMLPLSSSLVLVAVFVIVTVFDAGEYPNFLVVIFEGEVPEVAEVVPPR